MFFWRKLCGRFAALGRFTPWELSLNFCFVTSAKWKTWVFFSTKFKDKCRWKPWKMLSVSYFLLCLTFHITYKGGIVLLDPNKASSALGWLTQNTKEKSWDLGLAHIFHIRGSTNQSISQKHLAQDIFEEATCKIFLGVFKLHGFVRHCSIYINMLFHYPFWQTNGSRFVVWQLSAFIAEHQVQKHTL